MRKLPGERAYERDLLARVRALRGLIDPAVAQVLRTTAAPTERLLSSVLASVVSMFERVQPVESIPFRELAEPAVAYALRTTDREMRQAAMGEPVSAPTRGDALPGARFRFASPTGFAPKRVTTYDMRVAAWAAENARLVRSSIDEQYASDVAKHIAEAVAAGKTPEEIAAILRDRFGVRESRARLIASDQIGKLNGKITEDRQREAGVTRYRWRTRGDDRVRPAHADRDGRYFRWDDPPSDGHPGEPVNCRCHAEPVV